MKEKYRESERENETQRKEYKKCIHITTINDGDGSNYELKRIIKKKLKNKI